MRTLLLAAGFSLAATSMMAAAPELGPGRPFPDLRLPALEDGRLRSVADFRGQKLVLHIWASW